MSETMNILIVDDDKDIRDLVGDFLSQYGFKTLLAGDGKEMHRILDSETVNLLILDVMLPGDDGFELCRQVRTKSNLPIIMLTAIGEETDRIIGLEMGADDYLAKPFNPRELLARVKAILRRTTDVTSETETADEEEPSSVAKFDGWRLDTAGRQLLSADDLEITLSAGVYDLLVAFVENAQRVLSRDQLLDITRNREAGPFDRSIDVQISRLRHKIESDPKKPTLIKTVRGGGYIFTAKIERT